MPVEKLVSYVENYAFKCSLSLINDVDSYRLSLINDVDSYRLSLINDVDSYSLSLINASSPCDLGVRYITRPRKCQAPEYHKTPTRIRNT